MAIDFTNVHSQNINFGDVASSLSQKTITGTFYIDTYGDLSQAMAIVLKDAYGATFSVRYGNGTKRLMFSHGFSSQVGLWRTDENSAVSTTLYSFAISYDNSSVDNNPIFYLNGIAVNSAEVITPSGTALTGIGTDLAIGDNGGVYFSPDGRIYDLRIYNRILTPAEVATIYNMRGKDNIINGLVFHPMLKGAAGLSTFDGAVLGADNTIYDPYSQTYGVPVGSPIAVADNVLGW